MTAIEQKAKNFVDEYYRYAYRAGAKYGYNPLFLLAQTAFESGWGSSEKGNEIRNLWGTSAGDKWQGGKYFNGKIYLRVYPTFWAGWEAYTANFANNPKWYANVSRALQGDDIEAFADAMVNSPYISEAIGDSKVIYRAGLISIYNRIKEYKPIISFIDLQGLLALAICGGVGYGWYKLQTTN
jgi:flagellar protein FlgJ